MRAAAKPRQGRQLAGEDTARPRRGLFENTVGTLSQSLKKYYRAPPNYLTRGPAPPNSPVPRTPPNYLTRGPAPPNSPVPRTPPNYLTTAG
jgi:hypothetical protein